MREVAFFTALIPLSFVLAVATFIALFFVNAP